MRFACSLATLVALGGCVSTSISQDEAKQVTEACRAEVGAIGSYSVQQGSGGVPRVFPVVGAYGLKDGTSAEADALNTCIKRKVSSSASVVDGTRPVSGSCQKGSNPLQGGSGYC